MFQFQLGAIAVSAHHDGAPLSCFEVHPKSDNNFGDREREYTHSHAWKHSLYADLWHPVRVRTKVVCIIFGSLNLSVSLAVAHGDLRQGSCPCISE